MSESEEVVLEKALSFPAKVRAAMVEKLLESLDQPDSVIDDHWAKEAEDRIKAYDSGELKGVPGEEILKKYRKN